MVIAIDGTVCSGKSTIAKNIANRLGYLYCNTGAIYRAITLKILNLGLEESEEEIINMLSSTTVWMQKNKDNNLEVFLDGKEVSGIIHSPLISQNVSIFSKIPEVREFAKMVQVNLAKKGNCVIEGRDIGTVVFPDAEVKIFMTADDDVRAKRRQNDYLKQGKDLPIEVVKAEILERDRQDMTRAISPLKPADDAIIYYNNGSDIEKVLKDLSIIIENKKSEINSQK